MKKHYPLQFTLDNGTHVVVNHNDPHAYDFTLLSDENGERHFSFRDDVVFTDEMEEKLDFDQLNALRRFWLEQEKEDLD